MDDSLQNLWESIRSGGLDVNNTEQFMMVVTKGLIYKLNRNLHIRDKYIPHFIINTGDDIMYLEVKGQDHSVEPLEVSNEDYVYMSVPRCVVSPGGINIQPDQLTSPYSYGLFQVEHQDTIYTFRSEFRRIPLTLAFSLKYYFDNITDAYSTVQQIITNLAFINNFSVIYMGNEIMCSYKIPDEYQTEYMMEFDGDTTDKKTRNLSLDIEVQTNLPIIYPETAIPSDKTIHKTVMRKDPEAAPGTDFGNGINVYPKGGLNHEHERM